MFRLLPTSYLNCAYEFSARASSWSTTHKSPVVRLLRVGLASHVVLNALFSLFLLSIAAVNYPGGKAIARLQRIEPPDAQVNVHICNLAAQTGVSRFTQIYSNWRSVQYRNKYLLCDSKL